MMLAESALGTLGKGDELDQGQGLNAGRSRDAKFYHFCVASAQGGFVYVSK